MVVSATVCQVGKPLAVQADDRLSAPIAGVTVENHRSSTVAEFRCAVNDLIQGYVYGSLHVARGKLSRRAYIYHQRTVIDQLFESLRGGYPGGAKQLHSQNPEANKYHRDNDNYRVIVHGR